MKKIMYMALLFVSGFVVNILQKGQKDVFEEIQKERTHKNFLEKSNVFFIDKKTKETDIIPYFKNADAITFLGYDANRILNEKNIAITLVVPVRGNPLIIDMVEVPDTFYEYKVITSSGKKKSANRKNKHYRGIIRNDKKSLVALSFFKDEVIGSISYSKGTYNIAKIKENNTHIIYKDDDLKQDFEMNCDTKEDINFKRYTKKILLSNDPINRNSPKYVGLYFETEYDIFQNKGSVNAVENYVTALYNQVATIYQNESISTKISELKIWDTNDPYTGNSARMVLQQFQNNTNNFNGDLGQLLTFRSIGGGKAASFSGLCNSNSDLSLSVSGNLRSTVTPFPTYSWNVMVVTHEFGHLFGSRHTHACVWNGNDTAIDVCSGFTEGSCSISGIPNGGGTIMSYCHIADVDINFTLGFGLQPGNVIRNRVNNASCLEICEDCESDVVITQQVNSGQTDNQQASNTLTSTNQDKENPETLTNLENVGFQMYPNPVKEFLNIKINTTILTGGSVQIYSINGALVQTHTLQKMGSSDLKIDVSQLKKGIYMVKIINNKEEVFVKKIIKE